MSINEARIRELPTEDLIRMITENKGEYMPKALQIAQAELADRGVDVHDYEAKVGFKHRFSIGRQVAPPYWSRSPISRKDLQAEYKKRRIFLGGKWNIRQHLKEDPIYYTADARQFLFEVAKLEGISEEEVADICQEAEEKRKKRNTLKEFLLMLLVVAMVSTLSIFLLPFSFRFSVGFGIFSSVALTIGIIVFMWKRGW